MGQPGEDRIQRVLIGLGLSAVGVFSLLALLPLGLFGARLEELFPSGNLVGPVGSEFAGGLVGAVGISAAVVPFLLLLWGLHSFGQLERRNAARWTGFFAATLLLLPPLMASIANPPAGAGPSWLAGGYGAGAGRASSLLFGWFGTALLLGILYVIATLLILGPGPFRALARGAAGARAGASGIRRALGRWVLAAAIVLGRSRGVAGRLVAMGRGLADRLGRRFRPTTESRLEPAGAGRVVDAAEPSTTAGRAGDGKGRRKREPVQTDLLDEVELLGTELPPLELLAPPPEKEYSVSADTLDRLGTILVETLSTFKVEGSIVGRTTGPVVTQFEVVPASGVKVGKIAALADDLALALKAPSIRIVAPIPGKGAVGVEVPNPERKVVYLREILESDAYRNSKAELPLALGEDVLGRSDVYDLAQMPHLLIAGVTGSGKSVCINAIISSLIYRFTPERLRLLLVDPKMVELGGYNVLPHLRHPVVTDNNDAAAALKWLVYEMERRYLWLSVNGCRNLREFNRRVSRGSPIRTPDSEDGVEVAEPAIFPYIVLVIDELADLMMTVQSEVERPLAYLAQKARATGIHLVVATQRPSVNVITGLIKANFPCRIAFRVASKVDSRTIIDQNGAETLLGIGDMLFLPPGQAEPVRIQGTFVSTEDTERLMEWYRARREAPLRPGEAEEDIIAAVHQRELAEAEAEGTLEALADRDPLFRRAAEVVIQHQQGSTSLLQRRLKIGYGRAARIVDQLEHAGIVGPPEGSKPREVLVTLQDLERICAAGDGLERGGV